MRTSGDKLKSWRKRNGWSCQQVATAIGCERAHLTRIETGKTAMGAEVALKLAKLFSRDVSELFTVTVRPVKPSTRPRPAKRVPQQW